MDAHSETAPRVGSQPEPLIEMPRPTAWPMILALGMALVLSGLVTSLVFSVAGVVIAVGSLAGWIRQWIGAAGQQQVAWLPLAERARPVSVSPQPVLALRPGMPGHRARLPEKMHPYSAGANGGLIGGMAMAATALAYGAISGRGLWYPINLLAAIVLQSVAIHPEQFSLSGLIVATCIHALVSLGVGLIFGVLLPTLPRWPVFWGGVVGPLLWTGAIYSFMGVLNPTLKQAVDWPWFIVSQFVYGLVVGIVVTRSEQVYVDSSSHDVRTDEDRPS